jgi:hypothetical protein
MRLLHRLPLFLLVAAATFASPASADPADEASAKDAVALHTSASALGATTRALLAHDPRLPRLVAEIERAAAIKDKAARKTKLDAIAPRLLALRNEIALKAHLDGAEVSRKLAAFAPPTVRRLPKAPLPSGIKLAESTVTSFPVPFSFKYRCPDQDDKWDFDGKDVTVRASSAIGDKDCDSIMAGRGAVFTIPPGAKKVRLVLGASVDLDVLSASAGAFGEARGFFGVRLHLVQGAYSTTVVNGNTVKMTSQIHKLIRIHTTNAFPNPIPLGTDSFTDSLQEGDDGSTLTAELPPNPGKEIEITLITGGWADADLQGFASVNNLMTPKSLKVTFYN